MISHAARQSDTSFVAARKRALNQMPLTGSCNRNGYARRLLLGVLWLGMVDVILAPIKHAAARDQHRRHAHFAIGPTLTAAFFTRRTGVAGTTRPRPGLDLVSVHFAAPPFA